MPPTPAQEQIIGDETIGLLATLRRDGSPQLTPVNYAYEDGRFFISITRDRAKYPNIRRNRKVSLCIAKQPGWRPYVTVFGTAQIVEDDIVEGTTKIMRRMSDREVPANLGDVLRQQKRVLVIVTPERFVP